MLKQDTRVGQRVSVTHGADKGCTGIVIGLRSTHALVHLDGSESALVSFVSYDMLEPYTPDHATSNQAKYYDEHYASMVGLEPIELMQLVLSLPEFVGFLKGNIIKYTLRAGKKQGEAAEKDAAKAKRYAEWLMKLGYKMPINPQFITFDNISRGVCLCFPNSFDNSISLAFL